MFTSFIANNYTYIGIACGVIFTLGAVMVTIKAFKSNINVKTSLSVIAIISIILMCAAMFGYDEACETTLKTAITNSKLAQEEHTKQLDDLNKKNDEQTNVGTPTSINVISAKYTDGEYNIEYAEDNKLQHISYHGDVVVDNTKKDIIATTQVVEDGFGIKSTKVLRLSGPLNLLADRT